jgi:mono/diheme cytochrome c family protein
MKILAAILLTLAASASTVWQAAAETPLERGTYLMRSISACGNCHTMPGSGPELAGGPPVVDEHFTAHPANITPDLETGIGRWTDEQIITAIREGKRPDGSTIGPPMPVARYRGISDEDVKAIVAYLRQVAPARNVVVKSVYDFPLPPAYGPPAGYVAAVSDKDALAYGAYLAGPLGHCIECHSAPGPMGPDVVGGLGQGGMRFTGPWGVSIAANITPIGLKRYSDAELKKIITTGERPDGSHLLPPMGVAYYANMNDADVSAIIAYLRSLPPK